MNPIAAPIVGYTGRDLPRNTWLWKGEGAALLLSIMVSSFQIGADNIEELLRRFGSQSVGMLFGINEMCADVILDNFGHQTGDGPPRSGDEMHDLFAASFAIERALYRFDLAPDTAHARQ
jgi:hypothetical protein